MALPAGRPAEGRITIDPDARKMWVLAARVSAAVLEIVGAVMVGLYGGQYVGGRLGSPDIGLYVGGGLGVLAAVLGLRRLAKTANRTDP